MPIIHYKTDSTDPELTHIDQSLYLLPLVTLNAPNLSRIDGCLTLRPGATLNAPNLTYIKGDLFIFHGATLNAPKLTHVDGCPLPSEEDTRRNLHLVATLALATADALSMDVWHCGTSHCIAGWAQHAFLGVQDDTTARRDGIRLLGIKAAHYFYADNDTATKFLKEYL